MRLDVVHVPPEQTLIEYLNSGWIENIETGSVEELIVNGFPAATASAKGEQWSFRLYVVRFGSDIYRFIYAAKNKTAETDRQFRTSVSTFRRLSLAEIEAAKPLRIKVVATKPGDTVEQVATRMALIDRQVERFRILNGLLPGEALKPGQPVKIVVE
jgi:predicted Zn-dependent protease